MNTDYAQAYKGIKIDPYRICLVFNITHPAQQHALKKILRAGNGHNDLLTDIREAIQSLERWQQMLEEDAPKSAAKRSRRGN